MTGTWIAPIVIPIVSMICLATMIVAVVYAQAHPKWKHGQGRGAEDPSIAAHGRTWLDHDRDLATGQGTDQHEATGRVANGSR